MRRAPTLLALAVGLVGGGLLGDAIWRGAVRERSAGPPPGWVQERGEVAYRLSALSGPLELAADRWSLDFYRAIRPELGAGPASLAARVLLPEGGQIELWPAADRGAEGLTGVALVLERVGAPSAAVVQVGRERRTLGCSDGLPPPGASSVAVAARPVDGGLEVTVGGVTARCTVPVRGEAPVIRPGLRRVQISELNINNIDISAPGPDWRAPAVILGALLGLTVAALELLAGVRASLSILTSAPLLLAGWLGPQDLRLWAETARWVWLPVPWLGALLPGLGVVFAKGLHHLGRAMHEGRPPRGRQDWPGHAVLAAGMPVVLAVTWTPGSAPMGLATLAALGATGAVGLGLGRGLRRLGSARPKRGATFIGGLGSLAGCGAVALQTSGPVGIAGAMGLGLGLGLLVWANANAARARYYNLVCLAASALSLVGLETLVRTTAPGEAWSGTAGRIQPDDIFGWVPKANQEFQALAAAVPTSYPDQGYPVAVRPTAGQRRLVAMGGSTTGGAFQNDDLAEFYPARLAERLGPGIEVLNQGVGGWTTWHIRRYLERGLEALDPDVLILYVGHNDLLTPVPAPYSVLYERWRVGGSSGPGMLLHGLRLYQGLRYLVTSLRPAGDRVAVPMDEARENLSAIADAAQGAGARLLLASEGLAPDPGPLLAYNQMMDELARTRPDVYYVDVASALHEADGPRLFIDDCHLTDAGHRRVADLLEAALRREGLLESHGRP